MKSTKPRKSFPKPKPWKISRILVPVDFSEPSELALSHACALAAAHGAAVTVGHVGEPLHPDWFFDTTLLQREIIEQAQKKLEELAEKFCKGLKAKTEMRFGHPVETIILSAQKMKADVIVIGTHGLTGVKHAVLGSVAERVARQAPCPVLIVR
jgi:nucleotide-binding universal stress UspA family protein